MADTQPPPKKAKLVSLTAKERREAEIAALMGVQDAQDRIATISEQEAHEVNAIARAYFAKKRPLFEERQKAISAVPSFWLKVLLAHPVSMMFIDDCDQDALTYLEEVAVEEVGDTIRATFAFRPNPYFTDSQLWKEYAPPNDTDSAPPDATVVGVKASGIKWRDSEEGRALQQMLLGSLRRQARQERDGAKAGDGAGVASEGKQAEVLAGEEGEEEDEEDEEESMPHPSFFTIFTEEGRKADWMLAEALRSEIYTDPLSIFMTHEFEESDGEGDGGEADEGDDCFQATG